MDRKQHDLYTYMQNKMHHQPSAFHAINDSCAKPIQLIKAKGLSIIGLNGCIIIDIKVHSIRERLCKG